MLNNIDCHARLSMACTFFGKSLWGACVSWVHVLFLWFVWPQKSDRFQILLIWCLTFSTILDNTSGAPWLVLSFESRFGVVMCNCFLFWMDDTLGAPWLAFSFESRFGVLVCKPVIFLDDTLCAPWLVLSVESRFGVPLCHMFLDGFVIPGNMFL